MKIFFIKFFIVLLALSSSAAIAGPNRSTCKKYFSRMNLSNCEVRQDAAQRKLKTGTYIKEVVKTCIDANKLIDRKSVYIDYMGAEKCAEKEQARRADEYDKLKNKGTNIFIN